MSRELKYKLADIREYCDRICKISICMKDTLSYENYEHISLVPYTYNEYYVLGFGVIDGEFKDPITKKIDYFPCLEFMLSKDKIAQNQKTERMKKLCIGNPPFTIFSEKCKWNIRGVRGTIESGIGIDRALQSEGCFLSEGQEDGTKKEFNNS